jgi:hypothetical protein
MKPLFIGALVATLLLLLCHLILALGVESLQTFVSTAYAPGVKVEMLLSKNNVNGFGDWRTPVVIDAVTWLMFWALALLFAGLWRFTAGR